MARDPRLLFGQFGLVEITCRTLHGRFLLCPSDAANSRILGVLGRAQAMFHVDLHAFVVLSNHLHLLMTVASAKQMSEFWCYFKTNSSKELGRLHNWKGTLWGQRYHHAELGSDQDQERRLEYLFRNGCKEGLVASPRDWPGVSSASALCAGRDTVEGGIWYDRSAEYRALVKGRRVEFPSKQVVRLSPMPFLRDYTAEERQQYYFDLVQRIEQETTQMHEMNGTQPLGAAAILRMNPHLNPKKLESSPAPRFHVADPEERRVLQDARVETIKAYRDAAARLMRGEIDVRFPEGSFPPRLPFVESRAPT